MIGRLIVLNGFVRIEENAAKEDIQRVVNSVETELASLANFTRDWAHWDDTYQFVDDRNGGYIEANLGQDTQILNRMDFIVYLNKEGEVVWGRAVDLDTEEEVPFTSELVELLTSDSPLWKFDGVDGYLQGIVLIGDKPMLIVAYPVLTSQIEGPINGVMIQGRYLNTTLIADLGEKVKIDFSLHDIADPGLPTRVIGRLIEENEQPSIVVDSISVQHLAGYILLKDIYQNPILVIKAVMDRDIYQQGQLSMLYLAISTLLAGFIFGALIIILLDREVLSRLAYLSNRVKKIGKEYSLSQRVEVTGRDELSSLGNSINDMLTIIEESQEKLEQFVNVVSHDLRSPITALRSYVEMVQLELNNTDKTQMIHDLQSMEKISSNMHEMVEKLLVLSRIKNEKYVKEPVDLNRVMQKVRDNIGILLEEKNISLIVQSPLPIVSGYYQPIEEIFGNLIYNAVKFTQDKPNGEISVGYINQGQFYLFFVRDNGVGIPPENLPKLFNLFFRDGQYKGAGIGLSIVKEYVDLHGGKVWAESILDNGSTFWFSFPK